MKFKLIKVFKAQEEPVTALDFIAARCEISKMEIKKAFAAGAVWLKEHEKGKKKRLRRVKTVLNDGDKIEFYYDNSILNRTAPAPQVLKQTRKWGFWYKPPGLLAQGSPYGDHLSLLRHVAVMRNNEVFLVHRLDREAAGLMVLAYTKKAAGELSRTWGLESTIKTYQVEVLGQVEAESGEWAWSLDEKASLSKYRTIEVNEKTSLLEVEIKSGRYHQIRRHAELAGHPVIGDPKYGKGNKNEAGMRLVASGLKFIDPLNKREVSYSLTREYCLF